MTGGCVDLLECDAAWAERPRRSLSSSALSSFMLATSNGPDGWHRVGRERSLNRPVLPRGSSSFAAVLFQLNGIFGYSTYIGYICSLLVVKLTGPLERVLRAFLAEPSAPRYGYDLMKAAKLPSGTLYPMLARLQDEGLVTFEWEPQPTDLAGRPARKYYRLTGEGARVARLTIAQASLDARRRSSGTTRPATGGTQ